MRGLCLIAASCITVDVAMRWPADPDVPEIARLFSERGTEIPPDPEGVYDYLPGAVPALKSLPQVMGDEVAAATLPVVTTGIVVSAFRPEGESGGTTSTRSGACCEKAEGLDISVVPTLQVRSRMIEAAREVAQLLTQRPCLFDDAETTVVTVRPAGRRRHGESIRSDGAVSATPGSTNSSSLRVIAM